MPALDHEVIVIGSGFGGAILACRTAKKWPGGGYWVIPTAKR